MLDGGGGGVDLRRLLLLALGFLLAETTLVHAHFREARWTYAFGEVPLAIGLVVASPSEIVLAHLIGVAPTMLLFRRVEIRKVVFNLSQQAVSHVVAICIVDVLLGDRDRLTGDSWLIVLLAVVASTAVSAAFVAAVIRSVESDAPSDKLIRSSLFSLLISASNAAVALSAAVVIDTEPLAALFLLIPTVALFVSYRSYVNEHAQREAIESLYSSSRALTHRANDAETLPRLLAEVSSMFLASVVEATVRSADGAGATRVTTFGGRVERSQTDELTDDALERITSAVPAEPVVVSAREPDARFDELLRRHGHPEAMVGRLEVGGETVGVLVVAGPSGRARSFTRSELRLFGTLLHHAAAAFENGRLEVAIDEMREIERRLAHEALHDPLTGLANRTRFSRELAAVVGSGESGHALALVDLDDFKAVNDTYGHAVGDEVLVEVGRRLAASVRSTDLAARLGGDEFAVLFAAEAELLPAARRMLQALGAPFVTEGRAIDLGASVGVVRIDGVEDPERLLRTADAAMYSAKASGKGTVTEFDANAEAVRPVRQLAAEDLRDAATVGDIGLEFQPIIDLRSDDVVGVEAFARWRVDGATLVASDFLPELTSAGLVSEMDRLLVEQTKAALRTPSPTGGGLAVWKNVSVASLRDGTLVELLVEGLDADERSRLTIEVPASEIGDHPAAHAALERVAGSGVKVALDGVDAARGSLPLFEPGVVDVIKVRTGDSDVGLAPLVAYAGALGATVIATGVETEEQLEAVRRSGCERAQGVRLGRPVGEDELVELVDGRTITTSG